MALATAMVTVSMLWLFQLVLLCVMLLLRVVMGERLQRMDNGENCGGASSRKAQL